MSGLQGAVIARNGCVTGPQGGCYDRWLVTHRNVLSPIRQQQLDNRGEAGRPRVPQRCTWPLGPCAPGCIAKHVDLDALDTDVAA